MKLKLHSLIYIAFLVLFSACEQDDDPIPAEKVRRTVLVYVMGDNSLSGLISSDVNEMMKGMQNVDASQYNLLVYVDEAGAGIPALYRLSKDKNGEVVKETVREYKEQVSTDPKVLQEILGRAFVEYPADSYGLVLWSHGEGWIPNPLPVQKNASTRWIGQDTTDGTTYLNITDIASVLSKIPRLEFLLFDACFGQSVEVAYELREHANYIIGSPTEIPGPGAPYDRVVPAMFADANVGVEIGRAYYEPYADEYTGVTPSSNFDWTGGVSIAVVKCDALDELASVTKQTVEAAELNSSIIYDYDKRNKFNKSYIGYYDMKQLMQQLSTDIDALTVAIDKAIVYWRSTPKNYSGLGSGMFSLPQEETCGMSHYIPKSPQSPEAAAYRSTAWYKAAGLDRIGW